jgi:hypothetical protein
MKRFSILVFTLICNFVHGQGSILDSLYLNIPFDTGVKETYHRLLNNPEYDLLGVDTSTEKLDRIEFVAYQLKSYPFPAGAVSFRYQKNTLTRFSDSVGCTNCPKWESCITFIFDSRKTRRFSYYSVLDMVRKKLKVVREEPFDDNIEFYGKVFYLSGNEAFNRITVYCSRKLEDKRIYMSYY